MRRSTLAAVVLVSAATALAGCAALSGLDGISEQACAPDCGDGGATDGTIIGTGPDGTPPGFDVTPSSDHTTPDDTTTPPPDDATTGEDASDSAAAEGGEDAAVPDSGTDAGAEDSGVDATPDAAGTDSGCGPLTALANCSACGDVCTATNASAATCNGATCSYTCKTDYLDCNASSAPDTDGCECNAPGATTADCCTTACPIAHHWDANLTNGTFYICVTSGTYTKSLALAACAAYTGNAAECNDGYSGFSCSTGADGGGTFLGDMVCNNGSTTKNCNCWGYDDSIKGLVSTGTVAGINGCGCPEPGDDPWN